MKVPFQLIVTLPDGDEHTVATINMKRDGTVLQITTHAIGGDPMKNGWYVIEGGDLDKVQLTVREAIK